MYLPSQIISENNTEYRIESVSKYKSRLIMYLESPRRPGRLQSWLGQVRVHFTNRSRTGQAKKQNQKQPQKTKRS